MKRKAEEVVRGKLCHSATDSFDCEASRGLLEFIKKDNPQKFAISKIIRFIPKVAVRTPKFCMFKLSFCERTKTGGFQSPVFEEKKLI
jgi:hypothetical protein